MPGVVSANRDPGHRFFKISGESASAQTRGKCTYGAVTKDAPEDPDATRETDDSVFRFVRSHAVGTVVSIGTCNYQQCNCRFLHPVLSTCRLAVLARCPGRWLFPNLSGCPLAQRCDRDILPGKWRSAALARFV